MTTQRTSNITGRGLGVLFLLCLATTFGPLAAAAQEPEEAKGNETAEKAMVVVGVEPGELTVRLAGGGEQIFKIAETAKITLNGDSVRPTDLRKGDVVEIESAQEQPGVAVQVRATRPDANGEEPADHDHEHESELAADSRPADHQAWLGLALEPREDAGLRVARVYPDSPADKAGVESGDILMRLDGEEVESSNQLLQLMDKKQPGDEVQLLVVRGEEEQLFNATLGDLAAFRRRMAEERGAAGEGAAVIAQRLERLERRQRRLERAVVELLSEIRRLRSELKEDQ